MPVVTLKDSIIKASPAWLQGPYGAAFLKALADNKDAMVDAKKDAVLAKLPLSAPGDGLDAIGQDRQIARGLVGGARETDAAYASRLQAAWAAWAKAGTPWGVLLALYNAGYSNVTLAIQQGHFYTLDGSQNLVDSKRSDSSPWAISGFAPSFWSTFTVVFPQPFIASWVANGAPSPTSAEAMSIRTLINRWKPGWAACDRILLVNSGKVWGFPITQNWGAATGNWGAASTTIWAP